MPPTEDEYKEQCRSVYEKINTINDVFSLSQEETELLLESVTEFSEAGVPYTRTLQDAIGMTPPEKVTKIIGQFKKSFDRVEQNEFPVNHHRNHKQVTLWEIVDTAHQEGGDVYMGVSLNDQKAEAVWEENPANQIVSFQTTKRYALFQDVLDWKLLKEVDFEGSTA